MWNSKLKLKYQQALMEVFTPMVTRCCTLRRAKNTPTRSFVSNLYKQEIDVQ
jgi:hypothetical protein